MSAHSSSEGHHTEQETHETFSIDRIAALVCWSLAALLIFFWFRFQAFDSMPNAPSGSSLSFVDRVDAWWKEKTGPKELGGVKLGPAPSETTAPAKPATPATSIAIKEAKSYLVATDATLLEITATAKQYPNGYWISGSGEYRIGYYDTSGNWKTVHSHNYENGEIVQFPADRNWSKPIYAACQKGWKNVTVIIHPPD